MNNKFKANFDAIKASEELKNTTLNSIYSQSAPKKRKVFKPRLALATLAVLIISLFSFSYMSDSSSVMALSLDGDIAIELEVDDADKVIDVEAFDEPGLQLIATNNYLNENYVEVVESIQQQVQSQLTISVIYRNQNAKLQNSLANAYEVSQETQTQAHNYGISFGKYRICAALDAIDSDSNIEQYFNMHYNEIQNQLKLKYQGQPDNDNGQNGNGSEATDGINSSDSGSGF